MPRMRPAPPPPAVVTFVDGTSAPVGPDSEAAPLPATAPKSEAKTRVGFYMFPTEADEARGTYLWTRPHTGIKSFSDYIAAAVNEKAARDRETYNGGKSFGAVSAGDLPTGRPVEV
jgi:hypothetical protein